MERKLLLLSLHTLTAKTELEHTFRRELSNTTFEHTFQSRGVRSLILTPEGWAQVFDFDSHSFKIKDLTLFGPV